MGNTALLNAFAQSALDMKGFSILNCPTFTPTTPPQSAPLNVKLPPYNAVGDGVHDDGPAIQQALNDSAAAGGTVYLPGGQYQSHQSLGCAVYVSMLGDGPSASVIRFGTGVNGVCLALNGANSITKIGIDGNMDGMAQGQPTLGRIGMYANQGGAEIPNGGRIELIECSIFNTADTGIMIQNSVGVIVQDCYVSGCGGYGIAIISSAQVAVLGNRLRGTALSGIWIPNSQECTIIGNEVFSCGPMGYGIGLSDSDKSVVAGNLVQQCAVGVMCSTSYARAQSPQDPSTTSFGYVVSGNNIIRNYYCGVFMSLADGFELNGNVITENGQGGTDNASYTAQPGIVIDFAHRGSGYLVGDILTLVDGTFSVPAKAVVLRVTGTGAITNDGLGIITMGTYSVLPSGPNPLNVTGGHGSGAKVIFTTTMISATGSGYTVGMALRATNGTWLNPVKVLVTSVGSVGAVTGYQVIDGGGYTGTLPTSLSFVADGYSSLDTPSDPGSSNWAGPVGPDVTPAGSGFSLTPLWGLRYSQTGKWSPGIAANIRIYGPTFYGVISGNHVSNIVTPTGCGLLISDESSGHFNGRAQYINVVGNSFIGNTHPVASATGTTLDLANTTFVPNHCSVPQAVAGGPGTGVAGNMIV